MPKRYRISLLNHDEDCRKYEPDLRISMSYSSKNMVRLDKLPIELREQIYGYFLTTPSLPLITECTDNPSAVDANTPISATAAQDEKTLLFFSGRASTNSTSDDADMAQLSSESSRPALSLIPRRPSGSSDSRQTSSPRLRHSSTTSAHSS